MSGPEWIITTPEPMSADAVAALQASWGTSKVVVLPPGAKIISGSPEAALFLPGPVPDERVSLAGLAFIAGGLVGTLLTLVLTAVLP